MDYEEWQTEKPGLNFRTALRSAISMAFSSYSGVQEFHGLAEDRLLRKNLEVVDQSVRTAGEGRTKWSRV